jgi:hypothetical protein
METRLLILSCDQSNTLVHPGSRLLHSGYPLAGVPTFLPFLRLASLSFVNLLDPFHMGTPRFGHTHVPLSGDVPLRRERTTKCFCSTMPSQLNRSMLIPEKPSFRTIFYSVAIRSQLGISPQGKEVVIADNLPTVLIGERINPFGKGPLKEAVISGDMEPIRQEAIKQVEAGADILIISVAAFGIDETATLPRVTEEVINALDHNKVQREFPGDLCVEPPE